MQPITAIFFVTTILPFPDFPLAEKRKYSCINALSLSYVLRIYVCILFDFLFLRRICRTSAISMFNREKTHFKTL